jgi:hypothetical protein
MKKDEDTKCKKCGHPISDHKMSRAQKRANIKGAMVPDYPSGREEHFNYHSGMTDDDACSNLHCNCEMFQSPFA